MRKSTIVLDARHANKVIDGLGRYIVELINGLSNLVVSKVIILHTKDFPFESVKNKSKFTFYLVNIRGGSPKQHFYLPFLIRKLKADVYFYPFIDPPIFSPAPKNIFAVHDLNHFFFSSIAATNSKLAILMAKIFIYSASLRYDKIIVFSEFVKQQLNQYVSFSKKKTEVIYHGYSTFDNLSPDDPKIDQSLANQQFILYIGNNRPHKNLERLFIAFELLSKKKLEVKLVIAGNLIPRFFDIDSQIENSTAKEKIIRICKPSNGHLTFLYKNSLLVVYPSLSEGFGFPLLEAWAHGVPIATSRATCIPEIAGDAAAYFDPLDPSDIAQTIEKTIQNSERRIDLVAKGTERLAKYTWSKSANQHLQIFTNVI